MIADWTFSALVKVGSKNLLTLLRSNVIAKLTLGEVP